MEAARRTLAAGHPPKLRIFSPALRAFCAEGNHAKAFEAGPCPSDTTVLTHLLAAKGYRALYCLSARMFRETLLRGAIQTYNIVLLWWTCQPFSVLSWNAAESAWSAGPGIDIGA